LLAAGYHGGKGFPKPKPKYSLMNPNTYEINLENCQIRQDKTVIGKKRVKTAWHYEIGVFKDYLKEEAKPLMQKCFEFDWSTMKQPRYKTCGEDEVKAEMQKVYPLLKEQYRIQAGYSPNGNVFCIGLN
jgi:hypothetical protein